MVLLLGDICWVRVRVLTERRGGKAGKEEYPEVKGKDEEDEEDEGEFAGDPAGEY